MSYQSDIIKRLRDSELWPSFGKPDFSDKLDKIANRALNRRTVDGYLAAALLFQQLTEEMITVLLECQLFYIQLSVYPLEYKPSGKPKGTFGRRLEALEESIDFYHKGKIIKFAKKLNALRTALVHKLVQRDSVKGLAKEVRTMHRLYNRIFYYFDDAYDTFRLMFNDVRKDMGLPTIRKRAKALSNH